MDNKQLDPEMLQQIDMLLEMDVLEQEDEWLLMDDIETAEHADDGDES